MQTGAGTLPAPRVPSSPSGLHELYSGEVSLYRNVGRAVLPAGMRARDPR